ncbi:MAG: hypothetical protein IKG11_03810, partial [Atopobiaceae bacterium]|nr:hypothetical protein [Atopobiaceae bacterium]
VFTTQLEKSREAVDVSSIRGAYAEAMTEYMTNNQEKVEKTTTGAKQKLPEWQTTAIDWSFLGTGATAPTAKTDGTGYTVTVEPTSSTNATPKITVS